MWTQFSLLTAIFPIAILASCPIWPNGTDTREHFYNCGGINPIYNVTPFDANGVYEYPLHLRAPFVAQVNIDNVDRVYPPGSLREDIKIYTYSGLIGCGWTELPVSGLTDMDACAKGIPCPLPLGPQYIPFRIDLSSDGAVLGLLKDDAPYQMQQVLRDQDNGNRIVNCMTFQARCRTN